MTSSLSKRFFSTPNLLSMVVLGLGLWASIAVGLNLNRVTQADANAEFGRYAQRVSSEIAKRFRDQVLALGGLRGLYAARSDVKRNEFRSYVESLDRASEFMGGRGFGFIRHLQQEEVSAFIKAQRADGAPQFALRQIKPNSVNDLYVVQFLEPERGNQGALGLDLGSEVMRRAAAQRAMDSGEPTLTGTITLVQDQHKAAGVLLYLPVYANGAEPKTPEQRRATLVGLLYTPIVITELLDNIADVESGALSFQLFDNAFTAADGAPIDDGHGAATPTAAGPYVPEYSVRRALSLPGRDLTLRVSSKPQFDAKVDRLRAWRITALGVTISLLLALLLRQQMAGRRRAEDRAREMTAELALLADVIRHTHNAVSIADRESRITWVNEGFTQITGYSADEAQGKTAAELLGSGKADAATLAILREAIASGQGCSVEILNRDKGGREYWTATEIQPRHDDEGRVVGFMEIGIDITAQRQSQALLESALRENESLLSTLNLHAIVSVTDRTGRITSINDAFCAISGYSRDELLGQNHRIVNSGVQPPEFWVGMWETISCGMPWRGQVCNRAKDGSLYWVDTFVAPFIGDHGQIEKYVSIRTDITASKRASDALAWSQSLLQMMSNSSPLGFLVVDNRSDEILYFNQRFCEIWGVAHLAESMGRGELKYQDIMPDCLGVIVDVPAYVASCTPLQDENNPVTLEDEIAFTEQRTVRRYTRQIRDASGQYRGRFYIFEDITSRRLLQAESLRSAQLLRGAIDAIDEAFVLYDPQDRLLLCNDKYRQIYAASADLIVTGASFEDIVRKGAERGQYADAIGRVDAWVAERMAAHLASNISLIQHLDDGRVLRIIERRMADGHIVGFRIDITELVRATEAAEQASRSKSQFLANMSHEIRTPMNAILGMLRLLHGTDLSARQLDYASKTEGAAKSLLGLLNDILDFSKMEAGKMDLDPQPFRLDQLLRELSVIVSANVGEKPLEVLFDIDAATPKFLLGDAMRLQQVLINLSGNAIKFTAQGEVVVQIKVMAQEGADTTLRFSVRDSGIGIAPENQRRIFDGFSQAEASTTRRFGGTGLGLSISRRLVALMGGELALDSVLGQGSCFYFTLTLPRAQPQAPQGETLSERVGAPLSVLVVDDNALARELLVAMSQSWGWQVDAAADGAQALALMQARAAGAKAPYEAIFMDWEMPGLDGWETLERMRQLRSATAPVTIMVTAHGREMLSARGAQEQAQLHAYLVKPITASMLFDAVADARSGRSQMRASATTPPAGGRLQGMRLLVVEDNPINQQVARELLKAEGAWVAMADNGALGVQAVAEAATPFDAVLMDLQMPVMDGYGATRAIRHELGMKALPIIAMTANAMASDREACLAAGMNDHVGKPFDLNHLVRVLSRYLGQALAAEIDAAGESPLSPAVRQAAADAGIDLGAALQRLGGNQDIYQSMLRSFVGELATTPERLLEAVATGDGASATRLLHTLKGLAATMGIGALAQTAAQAEKSLGQSLPPEQVRAAVQTVCDAIAGAGQGLLELALALQADPTPSSRDGSAALDTAALARALQALAQSLRDDDMQAMQDMAELQCHRAVLGDRLVPLEQAMAEMDFERAEQECVALLSRLGEITQS